MVVYYKNLSIRQRMMSHGAIGELLIETSTRDAILRAVNNTQPLLRGYLGHCWHEQDRLQKGNKGQITD